MQTRSTATKIFGCNILKKIRKIFRFIGGCNFASAFLCPQKSILSRFRPFFGAFLCNCLFLHQNGCKRLLIHILVDCLTLVYIAISGKHTNSNIFVFSLWSVWYVCSIYTDFWHLSVFLLPAVDVSVFMPCRPIPLYSFIRIDSSASGLELNQPPPIHLWT